MVSRTTCTQLYIFSASECEGKSPPLFLLHVCFSASGVKALYSNNQEVRVSVYMTGLFWLIWLLKKFLQYGWLLQYISKFPLQYINPSGKPEYRTQSNEKALDFRSWCRRKPKCLKELTCSNSVIRLSFTCKISRIFLSLSSAFSFSLWIKMFDVQYCAWKLVHPFKK